MITAEECNEFVRSLSDDPAVSRLLDLSVLRVLLNAASGPLRELPDPEVARHVTDWLRASVERSEAWLSNTDTLGRPKKLMKFSTFESIVREADKAMRATISKDGVDAASSGHSVFRELEAGFKLIELKDSHSLKRESALMRHCVGNGGYDYVLAKNNEVILSLRDRHDNPHATLHVHTGHNKLLQLKGKQNKNPAAKYLEALEPYLATVSRGAVVFGPGGFVVDVQGVRHKLSEMPEGIEIDGSLDLDGTKLRRLPNTFTVRGYLGLVGSRIRKLPEALDVHGDLHIGHPYGKKCHIAELPARIKVGGEIDMLFSKITHIPTGLSVGSIMAKYSKIKTIGAGVKVTGNLDLYMCPVNELPSDLEVGGELDIGYTKIRTLPREIACGGISIKATKIDVLPPGIVKGGNVDCKGSKLKELPDDLVVVGCLNISDTDISRLPRDLSKVTMLRANRSKLTDLPDRLFPLSVLSINQTLIKEVPWGCGAIHSLWAEDSALERLPEGLKVHHLGLRNSKMTDLPVGLTVMGDLIIEGSAIRTLPDGLTVGGNLLARGSALESIGSAVSVAHSLNVSGTKIASFPTDFSMPRTYPYSRTFNASLTPLTHLPDLDVEFQEVEIIDTGIEVFPAKWKTAVLYAQKSELSKVDGSARKVWHTNPEGLLIRGKFFDAKIVSELPITARLGSTLRKALSAFRFGSTSAA